MTVAYYNENDRHAAEWLRNLIAAGQITPGEVDTRSILDVRPADLDGFDQHHFFAGIGVWSYALRLAGWPDDRAIWTASCPCQPFSAAGRRSGRADERHLWPALFHLIEQRRPGAIVGEQVASDDGLDWLDLVHDDMEGTGYAFGAVDTGSALHGAPHIRQRLRWVAHAMRGGTASGSATSAAHQDTSRAGRWLRPELGNVSDSGLLAHDGSPRLEGRHEGALGHERATAERGGGAGPLGNAALFGREGWQPEPRSSSGRVDVGTSPDGRPGPTNGFWRDPDWLFCRDGVWRPVEPGSFPLVDGSSFRLGSGRAEEGQSRSGMLKGYGNAVDAQATATFISAVDATLADLFPSSSLRSER